MVSTMSFRGAKNRISLHSMSWGCADGDAQWARGKQRGASFFTCLSIKESEPFPNKKVEKRSGIRWATLVAVDPSAKS